MEVGNRQGAVMQRVPAIPSAAAFKPLWQLASTGKTRPSHWLGLHGAISGAEGGEKEVRSYHSRHADQEGKSVGSDRGRGGEHRGGFEEVDASARGAFNLMF